MVLYGAIRFVQRKKIQFVIIIISIFAVLYRDG